MSGDYLDRLVAVPSANAIRLKVATIQCEHPSCAERLCGRGERRVRKVHRMVRVQLHELEGSREGGTVEQPHREATALDERSQLVRPSASRDRADALTQETFLRAWAHFDQFGPTTNCRAWLVGSPSNVQKTERPYNRAPV